jgi:hypothetical protein
VKATDLTTFDAIGEQLGLDLYEVQDLRLINGYYPTGEPKPGEWIRIFRQYPPCCTNCYLRASTTPIMDTGWRSGSLAGWCS